MTEDRAEEEEEGREVRREFKSRYIAGEKRCEAGFKEEEEGREVRREFKSTFIAGEKRIQINIHCR